jgi:hypothetical protein
MKTRTFVLIAILDSFLMALTIAYGAQTARSEDYLGMLFFYLAFTIVILAKIPIWTYIFRSAMDEENEENKDTGWTENITKGGGLTPKRNVDPIEWCRWNKED